MLYAYDLSYYAFKTNEQESTSDFTQITMVDWRTSNVLPANDV